MIKLTNILKKITLRKLSEECIPCQKKQQLSEYSDKTIKDTIERWKQISPNIEDNQAKQLIQRFDQIKSGLKQKFDIIVLPDELKKGNNYLDIDKYSYNDLVNLINSIPENPEKIKKEAVARFNKQGVDKPLAQSYVARFLNKKENLKYATEHGTEDETFSKKEVLDFIPKNLIQKELYLDPRNWRWEPFEQMLDALFPREYKEVEGEENSASTNADKVFDDGTIEIYKGDDVNKCISYNPSLPGEKRKKYGWCVTQPGNVNYDHYRFEERTPTFYIIFDRSKPSTPDISPFDNQWHAFVIQANKDGKSYIITGADNRIDNRVESWKGISKIVPKETWEKLKNLKEYFKSIPLSAVERGRKFASGKTLSADEFKELSQDDKILYVQGKSSKNELTDDILKILPKYKISYEGRSTTLANVAIDSGQQFTWNQLKDHESLARRYAIFRFRHTNYGSVPIPFPFIKFLDEESQLKYFNTFPKTTKFDWVEEYFGPKITKIYVEGEANKLSYLPKEAINYIPSNLRGIYNTLFQLQQNWVEEKPNEADLQTSPDLGVEPNRITYQQYIKIPKNDRDRAIELSNKSQDIMYSIPTVFKGQQNYYLLPMNVLKNTFKTEGDWVIIDDNDKIVQKLNNLNDLTINNEGIFSVEIQNDKINRLYPVNKVKIDGSVINLKENIYEDWDKYSLKRRAGILK